MKGSNIVDTVLIAFGLTYAISDIESILGITILIVQLVWILAKAIVRIYNAIKEKNGKEVTDSLNDLSEDLTDLKNNLPNQTNQPKEGDDDGESE
jgi:F0F1-type ATP synthase membrane subunit b/b'